MATGHGPVADLVGSRFNVIIGSQDTTSRSLTTAMTASTTAYLEIKVGKNAPISPRQVILAAPRALLADVILRVTPNLSGVDVAGNLGVSGDATIAGNAAVTGNVTASGKSVVVGEENLRIVRGTVYGTTPSASNRGGGYTATHVLGENPPTTTITFNPAFTGLPTITVTVDNSSQMWHEGVRNVTANNFQVIQRRSDNVPHNIPFHFIAIGPR